MKSNPLIAAIFIFSPIFLIGTLSQAQTTTPEKNVSKSRSQNPDKAPIYGSRLMTEEERMQYRDRMMAAKTPEEREQIRREHHEKMKERAREKGLTLPDEPGSKGMGYGHGPGGMGYGAGGMEKPPAGQK